MKKIAVLIIFFLIAGLVSAQADVDGSVSLTETVKEAVVHHPRIKSLVHNRQAINRNLAAALGRFFPSLNLSSNYGFQQYNSQGARNAGTQERTRTAGDSTLKLTQNIFDGSNRISDYLGSKARLTSAEYRLLDNVETVALDAIRAHVDVVRIRKLIRLAEENVTAHQEVLSSIAERVAGGAGSLADEMQARGRVARAETTLITYNGDLSAAEAEYNRLTGAPPDALQPPEFRPELVAETLDPVMENAMADNPKIRVYKAELDAKVEDEGMTASTMLPNVNLEVSTRYTDHLDGSSTYQRDDRAMVALSWNLFNGGSDYNNIHAAKERIREAEANLQDTIEDMTRQVATAWSEYETSKAQVAKHQEALQYSMESRDMYLMQFNVGQRSLLDVLDSINEVFSNSVLLETAQSNLNFTVYKFLALEGHLIRTLEISEESYDPDAPQSTP